MALKAYLTTKTLAIAGAVVLGLGGVGLAYNAVSSDDDKPQDAAASNENSVKDPLIADDSTSGGNDTKREESGDNAQGGNSSPPPAPSSTGQSSSGVTLEIKDVFQDENKDLVIQTSIKGTSVGTCKLTLSKGSETISKSAGVLYQPSFSTCKGFSVPISEIPEGGVWNVNLILDMGGGQSVSATKEVNINK